MNKGLKITLITLGVLGTGVGLYFLFRKPKSNGYIDSNPSNPSNPSRNNTGGGYSTSGFPLKRGSGGENVKNLQRFLNQSSGYGLTVDGKFGPATERALKSEQSPFSAFKTMYPNAVEGQASKEYYDNATYTSTTNVNSTFEDKDKDGVPDSIDRDGGAGVLPSNLPSAGYMAISGGIYANGDSLGW